MASKKEFVLAVVEQLKENPRAVLAGHGIQSTVLQEIIARPDVMSKLATTLWSLKTASKGAAGLKKSTSFKISGYKSFGEFNMKARADVETFVGGLPADDAAKFQNANNILTVIMLPNVSATTGEETTEESIVTGQSVVVTFDNAVRNEYKQAGGLYLAIFIGDSAIRTAEEKIAVRTEKVNKKKQARRTPAQIKAELKRKAAKKLDIIKSKKADLDADAYTTSMELEQYANIANELGIDLSGKGGFEKGIAKVNKTAATVAAAKAEVAALDAEDKKLLADAIKYLKGGKETLAKTMLKEIGNPIITKYVLGGAPEVSSADEVIKSRKRAMKVAIKNLVAKNEQLLLDLSFAQTQAPEKVNSIKSMMSKNNSKIKELRAKLGTYKNISTEGYRTKAAMLAQVNADIETNIKAGMDISDALATALSAIDAKDAEKEIIKQQVMEEVATGMPMQYAVQQAIQENYVGDLDATELGGSGSVMDIINSL